MLTDDEIRRLKGEAGGAAPVRRHKTAERGSRNRRPDGKR
jgi:hypothetical protein